MNRIYLEDLKLAVRQAGIDTVIEGFREKGIKKIGKAVTSIIETDKGFKLFSKCYDSSLYPKIRGYEPVEKQLSDEFNDDLFSYERKVLSLLTIIGKDEKNYVAPELYSTVESQRRLFMEYIDEPSLQTEIIEIDKEISLLKKTIKNRKAFNEAVSELQRQKEDLIVRGIDYIYNFRKLCDNNSKKFENLNIRQVKKDIDEAKFKDYLLRLFIDSRKDLKNVDDVRRFLKKKGRDIDKDVSVFTKYFSVPEKRPEELSLIHGDLGPHHIMSNGKIIDFDEFRQDSVFYDLVRFLKNPIVDANEVRVWNFLAHYILKDFPESNNIPGKGVEKLRAIGDSNHELWEKFGLSLKRFYNINIKEDIHLGAVLRKYSPKSLEFFIGDHPIYNTRKKLINWRFNDIEIILGNLLNELDYLSTLEINKYMYDSNARNAKSLTETNKKDLESMQSLFEIVKKHKK